MNARTSPTAEEMADRLTRSVERAMKDGVQQSRSLDERAAALLRNTHSPPVGSYGAGGRPKQQRHQRSLSGGDFSSGGGEVFNLAAFAASKQSRSNSDLLSGVAGGGGEDDDASSVSSQDSVLEFAKVEQGPSTTSSGTNVSRAIRGSRVNVKANSVRGVSYERMKTVVGEDGVDEFTIEERRSSKTLSPIHRRSSSSKATSPVPAPPEKARDGRSSPATGCAESIADVLTPPVKSKGKAKSGSPSRSMSSGSDVSTTRPGPARARGASMIETRFTTLSSLSRGRSTSPSKSDDGETSAPPSGTHSPSQGGSTNLGRARRATHSVLLPSLEAGPPGRVSSVSGDADLMMDRAPIAATGGSPGSNCPLRRKAKGRHRRGVSMDEGVSAMVTSSLYNTSNQVALPDPMARRPRGSSSSQHSFLNTIDLRRSVSHQGGPPEGVDDEGPKVSAGSGVSRSVSPASSFDRAPSSLEGKMSPVEKMLMEQLVGQDRPGRNRSPHGSRQSSHSVDLAAEDRVSPLSLKALSPGLSIGSSGSSGVAIGNPDQELISPKFEQPSGHGHLSPT